MPCTVVRARSLSRWLDAGAAESTVYFFSATFATTVEREQFKMITTTLIVLWGREIVAQTDS